MFKKVTINNKIPPRGSSAYRLGQICLVVSVLGGAWSHLAYAQNSPSAVPLAAPTGTEIIGTQNIPSDAEPNSAISDITVQGAARIEPKTIISYIKFKVGDLWSPQLVNESVKTLYATDLFSNVLIERNGKSVIIKIQENPSISRIAYEGNERIEKDVLDTEVGIKPRSIYSKDKVRTAVQRIIQLYQRKGRYGVIVEPKIIEQPENRIDLVFEITEGSRSDVKKINFIGNKYFTTAELEDRIITKEARWWRFLTSNDSYDSDRLNVDKDLLKRAYLNAGYADFKVLSAVAELEEDKSGFFITFTIDEGIRYKVDNSIVESEIPDLKTDELAKLITLEKNDYYSAQKIDDSIIAITDNLGRIGYAFVEIEPELIRDKENKRLSIKYNIQKGKQVYVERINIKGNSRTIEN